MNEWNDCIEKYWHDPVDFEFICNDFTERIKYCAIKCLGIKRCYKNNKNWIYVSVKRLIKKRQQPRKLFSGYKNFVHKHARKLETRNQSNCTQIATKKAKHFKKFNKNVASRIEEATDGDSKLLHQLYAQVTNYPTPPIPSQMKDCKIVAVTITEIARHFRKRFNREIVENET